jgi:transposase
MLIGVDYHPSFQQIAFLAEATGEYSERRLNHSDGEVEKFYRDLKLRGVQVQVGMEATGYSRWFERLLAELDFEVLRPRRGSTTSGGLRSGPESRAG